MGCIYFETVLNDFISKIILATQNILPFLSKAWWSWISVFFIFKYERKQKHNIISGRVISSQADPMYIEISNKKSENKSKIQSFE